jgi:pimeloyl-ACP methyl ester carboxylesterase
MADAHIPTAPIHHPQPEVRGLATLRASLLALVLLAAPRGSSSAQESGHSTDPVTTDPAQVDTAHPPSTAELAFDSKGSRLNGFFYVANGKGPHPTVILLHGFPGNERNLDLAQALRRAGMNVLFYSYRGAWGSGGTFSFTHALEDVASAIHFVRADSSVKAFGIDPRRVILVGHSMGGWLALMGAAADSSIACTVALDFWNVGGDGRRMQSDRQLDSTMIAESAWLTAPGGPLQVDSGQSLAAEAKAHADLWDPERSARALSSRPILLLSTTANESHATLLAALHAAHARQVTALQWPTDHGFSDRRIQLARMIIGWLKQRCGA